MNRLAQEGWQTKNNMCQFLDKIQTNVSQTMAYSSQERVKTKLKITRVSNVEKPFNSCQPSPVINILLHVLGNLNLRCRVHVLIGSKRMAERLGTLYGNLLQRRLVVNSRGQ